MSLQFFKNILPGTTLFKKFELVRCLSAGEVGGVYLCRSLQDDSFCALKIFSHQALRESKQSELFHQEVALSLKLRHPNVVRSHEFFSDESFVAFSMEYVSGGTLADIVEAGREIPVDSVVHILTQVTAGLVAIHEAGIIHRDLKPENILLTPEGTVKITDFGIASAESSVSSMKAEQLAGTVNYLSPEYIADGTFDERSDIYALGVIAYEVMTGKAPFCGDCLVDTLVRRVQFDPVPPREVRAGLPRSLSELAIKAMHRSPERRYQHARDILSHLELIGTIEHAMVQASKITATGLPQTLFQRPASRFDVAA